MKKERVIFRREYDSYWKNWGYIAIFPDDKANVGMVNITPFKILEDADKTALIEPYGEARIEYVLNRKLIHKDTEEAEICKRIMERHYRTEFEIVEKMTKRK